MASVPVKVAIRFQPTSAERLGSGGNNRNLSNNNALQPRPSLAKQFSLNATIVKENNNSIVIYDLPSTAVNNGQPKVIDEFRFDAIYEPDSATVEIYNEVAKELVQNALKGYNATLFAYGQSQTGKTYTVFGDEKTPGIVYLALDDIFQHISSESEKNRFFIVRLALLEIRKEQVRDLAVGENGYHKKLRLRETSTGFIFIENLIEEICADSFSARQFVSRNLARRHNSHVICRIVIESKQIDGDPASNFTNVSELNFVVLAGSEGAIRRLSIMQNQRRASEIEAFKEVSAINRSLLMLGLVIQQLSEGQTVANFRNSILTRVLQNALAGNSYTAIICTVSPKPHDMKHNLSTLKFAATAKQIRTKPQLNGSFPIEHAVLPRLQIRTASLKRRLSDKSPPPSDEANKVDEATVEDKKEGEIESSFTTRRMSWVTDDGGRAVLKLMAPDQEKLEETEEENAEANNEPQNDGNKEEKVDEIVYDNLLVAERNHSGDEQLSGGSDEGGDELVEAAKLSFVVGDDSTDSIPALFCSAPIDDPENYVSKVAFDAVNERMKSMKRQLIARLPPMERAEVGEDDEFEAVLERLCCALSTAAVSRRNSSLNINNLLSSNITRANSNGNLNIKPQ